MTFKLLQEAEKSWRRIVSWQQLKLIQAGREFKDGILVEEPLYFSIPHQF